MARTVWGAHKRYMDTYLNVYKGYYVIATLLVCITFANPHSSPVMEPDAIMKDTTGFEAESMMLSTSPVTVYLPPKSKPP